MRSTLVSAIALLGLAPAAFAQAPAPEAPAPEATAAPTAPSPAPAALPATAPPAASPLPAPGAPIAPPAQGAAPAASLAAAPTPQAPPAPPTDPASIALLDTLERVCIPAANGGNLAQAAKAAGYRKNGENYALKQKTFQLTVTAPGSNPTQCHVYIVAPVDPEAPAKPMAVALHDWAAISRGWDLYRNDKSVIGAQEFTTRSWEHDSEGKHEALVLTTIRKADGTPSKSNADTSEMIYSVTKPKG
ncbi:MAG: hypothetical protein ABI376_01150 [Caulobacteraceae bacterium]